MGDASGHNRTYGILIALVMKMHLSTLMLLAAIQFAAYAASPSVAMDDGVLIAHIKKTDYVFTTALSDCSKEKIERNVSGDNKLFKYTAYCSAKAADESDCPVYIVVALGTIDTENWATLRSIKLELECHG